jgi:RNA polymerase sigma-70 factor (ECF subfamily)
MSRMVHAAVIESKSEVIEPDRCRSRQMRDEELVYRVRSGDKNAFNELLQPHLSLMQYRVQSILQNDADTQDVVQDAMLCAFTKLHQLRAARFFRAWLMQIAVNCARMKLRSKSAGPGMESLDEIHSDDGSRSLPRQIVDLRDSPSVYFERREIYEKFKRTLQRLPLAYREVFILREIQQLSVSETASILQMTISMVKTNLRRAKLRLRQLLVPWWRTNSSRRRRDSSRTGH